MLGLGLGCGTATRFCRCRCGLVVTSWYRCGMLVGVVLDPFVLLLSPIRISIVSGVWLVGWVVVSSGISPLWLRALT